MTLRIELQQVSIRGSCWVPGAMNYGEYIPFIHRALANPEELTPCPRMPTVSCAEDIDQETVLYWEGCYHLLVYLLGWTNPGKGLAWFYANGKADAGSLHLQFLRQVYDDQGQLALLNAWAWRSSFRNQSASLRSLAWGGRDDWQWDQGCPDDMPHAWWREMEASLAAGKWTGWLPYDREFPESTPLHLGHILNMPARVDGELIVGEAEDRRAVLLLNRMDGWYRALSVLGRDLPDLGERSWHVDVVSSQLGCIGTFRRSRDTGLWFQGKHSVHVQGN